MIRLLHTGDVHLDSPFSGVTVQEGERLREELRAVFRDIMAMAGECFDAVLISGDLFDCAYISPDTILMVKETFEKFGRPVIVAPGNHDPYTAGSVWSVTDWPENVYIFSSSGLSCYETEIAGEPVGIWGWAFTSDRMDHCPIPVGFSADRSRINLLCAHGDTASPISRYCPLPRAILENSGFVYAALGHIHNPPAPVTYGDTLTAYSGFPQGRSFDETGKGGVMAAVLTCGEAACERITTGRHRYEIVRADVSGSRDDGQAAAAAAEKLAASDTEIGTSVMLRLSIEGAVPPFYVPDVGTVAALIRQKLPVDAVPALIDVRDATLPVLGAEYLEHDMTIRGELYRTLLPSLSSADPAERERAAAALRIGLLALDGRAFM